MNKAYKIVATMLDSVLIVVPLTYIVINIKPIIIYFDSNWVAFAMMMSVVALSIISIILLWKKEKK